MLAPEATLTVMAPLLALGVAYEARMPSPRAAAMEPPVMSTSMLPTLYWFSSAFTAVL